MTLTLLLARVAMGATFPFVMAALRHRDGTDARTFSFLYMANVLGATIGTLASAFVMIEVLGFRPTALVTVKTKYLVTLPTSVRR